jgi:heme-degrading monooxygenase HmoA
VIAVLFEAWPAPGGGAEYLDLAAQLRPLLDGVDGFVSVERFQSLADPGKLLSLSYWRDEESIRRWREDGQHRAAQQRGKDGVFLRYRLRIATVVREIDSAATPAADTTSG